METKKCKVCGESKILADFPRQQINKDGHSKTCYACFKARKNKSSVLARELLKKLNTEQKSRKKTRKQVSRIEEEKVFQKNKKELLKEQRESFGYNFCEKCKRSDLPLEVHHLFYRSEKPLHPRLHDKRNLVILCNVDHSRLHEKKSRRNSLVEERNLAALFMGD